LGFLKGQAMGFWDWLTGKPKSIEVIDRVWMNQEAKFQGLCKEIQGQLEATPVILVVAHFPLTLARLRQVFEQNNLPFVIQERRLSPEDFLRPVNAANLPTIMLVQADALTPDELPKPVVDGLSSLSIVVAERHFLPASDERIMAFVRSLGRRCRLCFHSSLQDPLMQAFAGEWVGQVLGRLGMKESEPIESAMVSRRIQIAQAKFAKQVTDERKANSAEEWLQWNVPG
jgi:preprotein translocase subunit SecA